MKIAYLLGSLNRGGAETLLADILARGGTLPFEAVCIYRNEGNMSDTFHATAVPMIRLERKRGWVRFGLRLRRAVRREGVQIVHAQSAFNAALAIIFLAFTGVKVVTTLHGVGFGEANILYKRLVYRHSSRIICVSEWEKKDYLRLGTCGVADRFVAIPNGINFSKFGHLSTPHKLSHPIRMCMVGNFVPEKNQYFICRFLKELSGRGIHFDFYFIGQEVPAQKDSYDRCVAYCVQHGLSDHVHFMGGRNDVPQLLSGMDAFIYASESETFGIAPVEAMAEGLPTFVNDLEVFVEITEGGRLAHLYKTDDVQDLCAKFIDFCQNSELYYDEALANASAIRNLYSINPYVDSLFSLYSQIL